MGGLFLLYRGLIDFRIPLIIILVELACLLVFPTPAVLTEPTQWHWIVSPAGPEVGWGTGITFANYELMASPSLFMALFSRDLSVDSPDVAQSASDLRDRRGRRERGVAIIYERVDRPVSGSACRKPADAGVGYVVSAEGDDIGIDAASGGRASSPADFGKAHSR